MNRWDCDFPGCGNYCVGTGGAIGLRAIGWYFVPGFGNNCFCPRHRPDGMPDPHGKNCVMCKADTEALIIQAQIPGIIENARDSDDARYTRELFHHWDDRDEVSDGV